MNELEIKKRDLLICKDAMKKLKRKSTLYNIADSFTACAGAASVFGIFIDPISIIPLAAFIGLGIYVTKKDEKNDEKICGLNADIAQLENEIFISSKSLTKKTETNKALVKTINS